MRAMINSQQTRDIDKDNKVTGASPAHKNIDIYQVPVTQFKTLKYIKICTYRVSKFCHQIMQTILVGVNAKIDLYK